MPLELQISHIHMEDRPNSLVCNLPSGGKGPCVEVIDADVFLVPKPIAHLGHHDQLHQLNIAAASSYGHPSLCPFLLRARIGLHKIPLVFRKTAVVPHIQIIGILTEESRAEKAAGVLFLRQRHRHGLPDLLSLKEHHGRKGIVPRRVFRAIGITSIIMKVQLQIASVKYMAPAHQQIAVRLNAVKAFIPHQSVQSIIRLPAGIEDSEPSESSHAVMNHVPGSAS